MAPDLKWKLQMIHQNHEVRTTRAPTPNFAALQTSFCLCRNACSIRSIHTIPNGVPETIHSLHRKIILARLPPAQCRWCVIENSWIYYQWTFSHRPSGGYVLLYNHGPSRHCSYSAIINQSGSPAERAWNYWVSAAIARVGVFKKGLL